MDVYWLFSNGTSEEIDDILRDIEVQVARIATQSLVDFDPF